MFSKENLKAAATTGIVVLICLAIHQKFIAPQLVKKTAIAAK